MAVNYEQQINFNDFLITGVLILPFIFVKLIKNSKLNRNYLRMAGFGGHFIMVRLWHFSSWHNGYFHLEFVQDVVLFRRFHSVL